MKCFRSYFPPRGRPARSDDPGGMPRLTVPFVLFKGLLTRFKRAIRDTKPTPTSEPPAFRPPSPIERYVLSARVLSHLAMLCWGISLCLPVFVYSDRVDYGGNLLARGWLGILGLQFPWLANPLLLIAYIRLQNGYQATGYACAALVVALQTFTNSLFEQSYGYGWGLVLWFMSLALMLAAAGAFEMRGGRRPNFENAGWLRSAGLILFALIGGLTLALAFYDHQKPNLAEAKRMEQVAIKRGAVCRQDVAATERLVSPLSGVLEVKQLSVKRPSDYGKVVPLYAMLDWGIPVLRSEGRDYFYIRSSKETLLSSLPAQDPAGATLEIDGTHEGVRLRLLDGAGAPLFDQFWASKGRYGYCPDYFSMPKSDQQPRLIIAQALGLNAPASEMAKPVEIMKTRLAGQVIGRSKSPPGKEEGVLNAKCAQGVRWEQVRPVASVVSGNSSKSFMIGRQAYYPSLNLYGKALCQGPDIYLYSTNYSGAKTVILTIEKRQLVDFSLVGRTDIQMDNPAPDQGPLQLESISNKGEVITLEVSRPELGLKFNVEATSGF